MVPLRLQLYNFMSYKRPEVLDFSSFDLGCLTGLNGSGKSALLEAITWALWGKSRASSDDELIHHGESGMWVEFEFELDGKEYRVMRKRDRKKGQSELSFQVKEELGWASLNCPTLKETQERILKTIHLPYEIFKNSAYLRQGHADEFTTKPTHQRKEILGKVLGLDFYENLSQVARSKIKEKEIKEEILVSQIEEMKIALTEKPETEKEFKKRERSLKTIQEILKKEEERLKSLERDKQKIDLLLMKIKNSERRISEITQEGQKLKNEVGIYEEEIKNLEGILKEGLKIEKGYQKLKELEEKNKEYNQKLAQFSEIQGEVSVLKNKEEMLIAQVKEVQEKGKCPTCLRPMSDKEAKEIISHLKKEFQKKEAPKLLKLEDEIKKIGYQKEEHKKIKNEIERLAHFEEEKKDLDKARTSLEEKKGYLKKIKENLILKRKEYQKTAGEKGGLEEEFKKLRPILEKWQREEEKVEKLKEKVLEEKEGFGQLKQKLSDLKEKERLFKSKKEEVEKLAKEKGIYKELMEIFSKKGIQARILEITIPEIEEEANRLLSKMTDGKMKVSFQTQRAKKSDEGKVIETLDIKITDELGDRDYLLYSGGEAFKIDLAIRIALSKILSRRAGAKLQFLVIDEGFGSLDRASQDVVVSAINGIKSEFKKILVVTHIQELKDAFETQIAVEKDEKGSHFEVLRS